MDGRDVVFLVGLVVAATGAAMLWGTGGALVLSGVALMVLATRGV